MGSGPTLPWHAVDVFMTSDKVEVPSDACDAAIMVAGCCLIGVLVLLLLIGWWAERRRDQ